MNNIANKVNHAPVGFTVSLKGRALRLLSGREYSRAELVQKLKPFEANPGHLDQALDELQAKDFINEQRVVDSVLHRKSAKLGTARIKQELQSKGLAAGAVLDAVDLLKSTELARAREVWRKKFGTEPSNATAGAVASATSATTTAKDRARQMRFLLSRGFAAEVIHKVMGSAGDDD